MIVDCEHETRPNGAVSPGTEIEEINGPSVSGSRTTKSNARDPVLLELEIVTVVMSVYITIQLERW